MSLYTTPGEYDSSNARPPLDYNFQGLYYFGSDDELAVSIYLKDFDDGSERDISDSSPLLVEVLNSLQADAYGIARIMDASEVALEHRREASAYLTIGEAYARGERIPKGVRWGVYQRGEAFYLWVGDSG
jgi:hypothetical protein